MVIGPTAAARETGSATSASPTTGPQTSANQGASSSTQACSAPTPTPSPTTATTAPLSRVYTVFGCVGTAELLHDARRAGFEVWTPYLQVRRVHAKRDAKSGKKTLKTTLERVPAMPGYIFCPYGVWEQFQDWTKDKHRLRLCMASTGAANATGTQFTNAKVPAKVHRDELLEMENTCKSLWEGLHNTPEATAALELLEVGDAVAFVGHNIFNSDTAAEVERCRPTGMIRVRIVAFDTYVEVHRGFLRKLH